MIKCPNYTGQKATLLAIFLNCLWCRRAQPVLEWYKSRQTEQIIGSKPVSKQHSPVASVLVLPQFACGHGVFFTATERNSATNYIVGHATTFKTMAGGGHKRCAFSVFRTKIHSLDWTGSFTEGSLGVIILLYFWEPSSGFNRQKRGKITFKIICQSKR